MTTREMLVEANKYKSQAAMLSTEQKNAALGAMAEELLSSVPDILAANAADVKAAEGRISDVMVDRLRLTGDRIKGMADGMLQVAALPDPVGRVLDTVKRPSGIVVKKGKRAARRGCHNIRKPTQRHF